MRSTEVRREVQRFPGMMLHLQSEDTRLSPTMTLAGSLFLGKSSVKPITFPVKQKS